MSFECKYGVVRFDLYNMPACCGMTVIGDVSFDPINERSRFNLYKEFLEFIKSDSHEEKTYQPTDWYGYNEGPRKLLEEWRVKKYIMTDRVYAKARHNTIQEFCEYTGWLGGTATYNPNSRNNVKCWEFDIGGTVK